MVCFSVDVFRGFAAGSMPSDSASPPPTSWRKGQPLSFFFSPSHLTRVVAPGGAVCLSAPLPPFFSRVKQIEQLLDALPAICHDLRQTFLSGPPQTILLPLPSGKTCNHFCPTPNQGIHELRTTGPLLVSRSDPRVSNNKCS